ncbi:MAG: capsule assembly Wzi family protein [Leeuwenhoekiella sp.]
MKFSVFKITLFFLMFAANASAQDGFSSEVMARGFFASGENNPFWMYSNQKGRIDQQTDVNGLVASAYLWEINENSSLKFKGGLAYKNGLYDDDFYVDELFASYRWKTIYAHLGVRHRDTHFQGISSVGGDVLWSNNARALPGLELGLSEPFKIFKWFYAQPKIAHYELNDTRFQEGAQVHFKSLYLDLRFSPKDILSGELKHYVQWGGFNPRNDTPGNQLPEGFTDFIKVFFGSRGGENATNSDQVNVLGNHIGSYELKYRRLGETMTITAYHQSIFEDQSGRELNNFPDGVWGILLEPKNNKLLSGIILEYVQTVSQSGRFISRDGSTGSFSGSDNYFIGNTYDSGWTYQDRIIGLPFIFKEEDGYPFTNSRSYVYHLGATGQISKLNYKLKLSYVENLGTYGRPIDEKAVYSFADLVYPTSYGDFLISVGADLGNGVREDTFGGSLGYRYNF